MNRNLVLIPIAFVVYLLLQILLFRRVVLFDTAFCFVYLGFILFLPMEITTVVLMLLAFTMGIAIDIFQNSPGLHAGASVLLAFVRNRWLLRLTPQGGYEAASGTDAFSQPGLLWLLSYISPLILLHHLLLFFSEAGGFHLVALTTGKVLASVLFTVSLLFFQRILFYRRR